jgi:hypothetical protein
MWLYTVKTDNSSTFDAGQAGAPPQHPGRLTRAPGQPNQLTSRINCRFSLKGLNARGVDSAQQQPETYSERYK